MGIALLPLEDSNYAMIIRDGSKCIVDLRQALAIDPSIHDAIQALIMAHKNRGQAAARHFLLTKTFDDCVLYIFDILIAQAIAQVIWVEKFRELTEDLRISYSNSFLHLGLKKSQEAQEMAKEKAQKEIEDVMKTCRFTYPHNKYYCPNCNQALVHGAEK